MDYVHCAGGDLGFAYYCGHYFMYDCKSKWYRDPIFIYKHLWHSIFFKWNFTCYITLIIYCIYTFFFLSFSQCQITWDILKIVRPSYSTLEFLKKFGFDLPF